MHLLDVLIKMEFIKVKAGGFNGPRSNEGEIKSQPVPQREPDRVAEEPTSPNQVLFLLLKLFWFCV